MTPHQFLQFVPATNCGECGYPACLAFAVAVTKGGVEPTLCPYVKKDALPEDLVPQTGDGSLESVGRGQEERDMALVAHLKSKVQELDFQSLAPRLGAGWNKEHPDELQFFFLGRPVRIGKKDVAVAGEQLVDPRDQILLYNYVAFGGGRIPDGNWVGMESLPNSISKIRTLATYCELRLAKRFSGRGAELAKLCMLAGGRQETGELSADVAMFIPVLPHVPHLLLFWDEEPEDGFEAKVKVLFDQNVMDFLDLESLVFAAERMADRLAELDK
jgi:hypothetical protein